MFSVTVTASSFILFLTIGLSALTVSAFSVLETTASSGNRPFGFITGFRRHSTSSNHIACRVSSSIYVPFSAIAEKYYQLEELEDADRCTTELFLHGDYNVVVHQTDGPRFIGAEGTWEHSDNDGGFTMTLKRRFDAGREQTHSTDMGEFQYETVRKFIGQLALVGDKIAMEGKILDIDDTFGNRVVGFFEMIDTTKEKMGQEDLLKRLSP